MMRINWSGSLDTGSSYSGRHFHHALAALVILLVLALTSLGVIASDLYTVGVSQVGILVNPYTGEFSGPVAGPTLSWKSVPWINVVIVSTAVETIQMVGPRNNNCFKHSSKQSSLSSQPWANETRRSLRPRLRQTPQ